MTAADGKDRNIPFQSLAHQRYFSRIALGIWLVGLGLSLFAVQSRIDIGTPGEDHTVEIINCE
jgi:hypothetical protein